jgi:hypothetical protein
MKLIEYFGTGSGLYIFIAILTIVFTAVVVLVIKSTKKAYAGRIIIPVFFIELALAFGIVTLNFPNRGDDVGPGVVPGLWLIAILIFSGLLLFKALLGTEEQDPPWGHLKKVIFFIVMTILYIIVMQYIGYYLSTIIYLILGMYYLSYRNWVVMISITAGWVVFSYFAFYRLLYVPLPQGMLIERIFG